MDYVLRTYEAKMNEEYIHSNSRIRISGDKRNENNIIKYVWLFVVLQTPQDGIGVVPSRQVRDGMSMRLVTDRDG